MHPVLALVNRCDELARTFDSTFEASCNLLRQPTGTLDDTLAALRSTLDQCEQIVGAMLACIYEDIPHLLDQLDSNDHLVANWNPKLALESISSLFYVSPPNPPSPSSKSTTADFFWTDLETQSYQELLLEKRELLADFTCEEISPQSFVQQWTQIDRTLSTQRQQQVDDLADLLAAF